MRGRFGLFGVLFLTIFVLIVGGIGYSLGASTVPVETTGSGTVVYGAGFWHPFGFGLFGILFLFLFIGLILAALRPRRWSGGPGGPGAWGRGWGGHGGWGSRFDPNDPRAADWLRDVPPAFRPMLETWHRQAHGEPAPTPGSGAAPSAGRSGTDGPPPVL